MITFNGMGTLGFGRLGNQMFQYALLFGVSKKLNFEFGVPYSNKSSNDYANFCLDEGFKITALDASKKHPAAKFKEKKFNFDESVFSVADHTDFEGFFQSERYFAEFSDGLRGQFEFKDEIVEKSNAVLERYDSPLASICVRRGDYLSFKKIHHTCNSSYFMECAKKLPKQCTILVFTDDAKWASEIFPKHFVVVSQDQANRMNKFTMMRCMSMCDYHVMSNSSFCWWSVWLCDKSKKVFAPRRWFGKGWSMEGDTSDLYFKNWEIVENDIAIKIL
jgi:hypothetical protein